MPYNVWNRTKSLYDSLLDYIVDGLRHHTITQIIILVFMQKTSVWPTSSVLGVLPLFSPNSNLASHSFYPSSVLLKLHHCFLAFISTLAMPLWIEVLKWWLECYQPIQRCVITDAYSYKNPLLVVQKQPKVHIIHSLHILTGHKQNSNFFSHPSNQWNLSSLSKRKQAKVQCTVLIPVS
jgi:hypothetical protein